MVPPRSQAPALMPALVEMSILPIAAHLFIFYFGIMSAITPPVAMSSFVAASIAESPPMKTAWAGHG